MVFSIGILCADVYGKQLSHRLCSFCMSSLFVKSIYEQELTSLCQVNLTSKLQPSTPLPSYLSSKMTSVSAVGTRFCLMSARNIIIYSIGHLSPVAKRTIPQCSDFKKIEKKSEKRKPYTVFTLPGFNYSDAKFTNIPTRNPPIRIELRSSPTASPWTARSPPTPGSDATTPSGYSNFCSIN